MRNIKTREGFEFWDKLNALPRYAFLLSPSGKSVQKFEDQAMGNWIDVHEAQKVVDQAQEEINQFRAERDALQLRLNAADQRIDDAAHYMRRTVDLVMRDCGNSYANAWCEKLLVIAKSFGAYDGATIGNIIDLREALQAAQDGR
jgi:hypothetical protein